MSAPEATRMTAAEYEQTAQEYLASLPLEHFMEAKPQATQREITLASFALLRGARSDFHYFNEMLVQYFFEGNLKQVVPDNMVVLGQLDDGKLSSYAPELELVPPFWTLEYVSPNNKRKDYVDNFHKYQYQLKVPYYLLFDPETQVMQLHRHDGTCYQFQEANPAGRRALPELDLELAVLDGWVRYWHRGELLPLPAELQARVDEHAKRIRELEKDKAAQAEQIEAQAEQIRQRDQELVRRNQELVQRDQELVQRDQELAQRDRQMEALVAMLRPAVEAKARLAGRQDILERLPVTTDGALLTSWLTELA